MLIKTYRNTPTAANSLFNINNFCNCRIKILINATYQKTGNKNWKIKQKIKNRGRFLYLFNEKYNGLLMEKKKTINIMSLQSNKHVCF